MTNDYLTDYAAALGRLMANLASLERSLRSVLYAIGHPPHTALPTGMFLWTMRPADQVPLNALTSWATLGELIAAFNASHQTHNPPLSVDPALKTLRDAFAHGRLVAADETSTHLVLMRFRQPTGTSVVVEDRYELTIDWMNTQIIRSREAIDIVTGRLRELYP